MAHQDAIDYLRNLAADGCEAAKKRLRSLGEYSPVIKTGSVVIPSQTSLQDARAVEYYSKHPELMRTE